LCDGTLAERKYHCETFTVRDTHTTIDCLLNWLVVRHHASARSRCDEGPTVRVANENGAFDTILPS